MIKIAIIGTGGISHAHMKGYLQFPEMCQVVALCDIYPEKAEEFSRKYSLNARVYDSHEKLLQKEELDGVSVCTPPYVHREISINAMKAGVDVFCEKPMAPSVEDCEAMIQTQKETGRLLSICHQNRFRNDIQEVKHIMDSGLMGKILFSRIDSFWWRARVYYDLWWRGTWEKEGGGCVLNHAVHHLDLLLWFLGAPKSLYSHCSNLAHNNSEVEDFGTAIIEFENDSIAQFTTSVMSHGEDQQLLFQCEKGKIVSPWKLHCSLGRSNGFPDGKDEKLEKQIESERKKFLPLDFEEHAAAVRNFLQAISGEKELLVTGLDGKNAIELITLFYQSSKEGKKLKAEIQKDNPWYTIEGILKEAPHYFEKGNIVENFDDEIIVGNSKN